MRKQSASLKASTKKAAATKSLVSEIPRRIVDPSAETTAELAAETGRSECWMQRFARAKVAAGEWEQVFKKVGRQVVPAYRRAR